MVLNSAQDFTVQRGTAISVPERIAIFDSQAAVLATDASGKGQGHIYKADAQGNQTLANPAAAATAGDTLGIYCVGLGAVNPTGQAGDSASLTTLGRTVVPVSVPYAVQFPHGLFAA